MNTTMGQRIRELRESRNLKQTELAQILGVSDKAVSSWETDTNIPRMGPIEKMSKLFNVTKGYIVDGDQAAAPRLDLRQFARDPALSNVVAVTRYKIPIIGRIAAGIPIVTQREYETYANVGEDPRADFGLIVDGDSMEPTIRKGDMVFIRQQPDVEDGEIAAVIIDESATLKHVYHIQGGVQLVSENPKYPPMTFTKDNSEYLAILGKAVSFKRIL